MLTDRINNAIHDLNHDRPRPVLGGRTAKEAFEQEHKPLPARRLCRRQIDEAELRWQERARSREERRSTRRKAIEEVLSRYGLLETKPDVSTNKMVG